MAESVSFWICKCGKAVDKTETKCPSCGNSKPLYKRRSLISVTGIAIFGIFLLTLASGDNDSQKDLSGIPETQKRFNTIIKQYADRYSGEGNPVEREQILAQRNEKLADTIGSEGKVSQWEGLVRGLSVMDDGASVSLDIGSAELISGHSADTEFKPAIRKRTEIYETLSGLDKGEKVRFSGSFVKENDGGMKNLNWFHEGEATAPEFHFYFTDITSDQN